jgi:hypothetical protein
MMQKRIHIVSFDVPFSPDYGGILDVYLRAKALKLAGFYVIIHAFEYGRGKMAPDNNICDEVHYYERRGKLSSLSVRPYIVNSRKNKLLLKNLLKSDGSIILEGEHCTSFIHELEQAGKRFVVRAHNVEWQYYNELANHADTLFKKTYYRTESRRLKHHEHHLFNAHLLCISEEDQSYYAQKGVKTSLVFPPLFFDDFSNEMKDYALFHGNLSVAENIEAVRIILKELRESRPAREVIFAGKNPSAELIQEIHNAGLKCIVNPDNAEMEKLIFEARIHLCIGFQRSGLKMKLLRALETGHQVITTPEMLHGTQLHSFCIIWDEKFPLTHLIDGLKPFTEESKNIRLENLKQLFAPEKYVRIIEETLFN